MYGVIRNASKYVLGEASVRFLGHIVSAEGISPIPMKAAAILNFPKPETIKELRRFLAICNFYRRFILQTARIQAALNDCFKRVKKNDRTAISWSEEALCLRSEKRFWQRPQSWATQQQIRLVLLHQHLRTLRLVLQCI
ncbi:uncharacterized protein LOC129959214 [Argiope bruennichi]|uniref:uncharacterized protein LOC129959214 n=1 Tax=Argiope bruennichi TaxID=94029 RepID=UPI002495984C|nr:uncharacterized protein LOC129959214 [Argiope bruennichi]